MPEEEISELVRESDSFTRCSDCGTYVVSVTTHRCPGETTNVTRDERLERAQADSRDRDSDVGMYPGITSGAYAYHELDNRGNPLCSTLTKGDSKQLITVPRRKAQRRNKSPCGHCQRVLDTE